MGFVSKFWDSAGPDSHYSWLVAVCACLMTFASLGSVKSMGVLYTEILENFHLTREQASWPFCLQSASLQLAGTLPGILVRMFSPRQLLISAVISMVAGLSLTAFATNLEWINVTFGIIFGIGTGIGIPTTVIVLNQYFDKNRGSANGLQLSGDSLSTFLLPPFTFYLLENYRLRGAFLMLGGTFLHLLMCGMLMRPIPVKKKKKTTSHSSTSLKTQHEEESQLAVENGCLIQPSVDLVIENNHQNSSKTSKPLSTSVDFDRAKSDRLLLDKNVFHLEKVITSNGGHCENEMSAYSRFQVGAKRFFRQVVDINTNYMFLIIALSSLHHSFVVVCYCLVIVDFGMENEMERQIALYLASVFGATELLSRLLCGWITDRGYITRQRLIVVVEILSGIVIFAQTFVRNHVVHFVLTALNGFFAGSVMLFVNTLFFEIIGKDNFPIVLSSKNLFAFFVCIFRPMIIGAMRDRYGTYHHLFHLLGSFSILCGLSWFLMPLAKRTMERRKIHRKEFSATNE